MAPFGLLPTLIELWRSIVHDRAWCPGQVWREGFLRPMLLKMVTALRPGGSKHFATDVESIKAPWSQMTAWDQELKWKVTAFAGHLILSVTTRRSHRRSGLEAKLSREMERWKRTCFCVRFAKDHGRLEPLNAMGMSFNRNNWTIIYIYVHIIIITNAATTFSSFSDASIRGFGGWCPQNCRRTWACSRLQLCRLGLLTYSTLPHDSHDWGCFENLLLHQLTTSQISFIHVGKFW